jgi:hypothetical protein
LEKVLEGPFIPPPLAPAASDLRSSGIVIARSEVAKQPRVAFVRKRRSNEAVRPAKCGLSVRKSGWPVSSKGPAGGRCGTRNDGLEVGALIFGRRLRSVTSYDRPTKKIASSAQALSATLGIIRCGPSDLAAITQKDELGGYSNCRRDQFAPGHPIKVEQNEYSRRTGRRLAEARMATG